MNRDALLIYDDGSERHISIPESRSGIPEPNPSHILLHETGEVLAYSFRGSKVALSNDPSDVAMERDHESPEECPVYRQISIQLSPFYKNEIT